MGIQSRSTLKIIDFSIFKRKPSFIGVELNTQNKIYLENNLSLDY